MHTGQCTYLAPMPSGLVTKNALLASDSSLPRNRLLVTDRYSMSASAIYLIEKDNDAFRVNYDSCIGDEMSIGRPLIQPHCASTHTCCIAACAVVRCWIALAPSNHCPHQPAAHRWHRHRLHYRPFHHAHARCHGLCPCPRHSGRSAPPAPCSL